MRLCIKKYGLDIHMSEDYINVLSVENQEALAYIVDNLELQFNGKSGELIFSKNNEVIDIPKSATFIDNIWKIDFEDKKIFNRIYKDMSEIAMSEYYSETNEVTSHISSFIECINSCLTYDITYDEEADLADLFKAMNVKLNYEYDDIVSRVIEYLRVMRLICGIDFFIFLNIKYFFSTTQLEMLYEFCMYEKVKILIVEGMASDTIKNEKSVVLDKDLCIIER